MGESEPLARTGLVLAGGGGDARLVDDHRRALGPLVLSIPINVLLSSAAVGKRLRRQGIFLTPEEIQKPPELLELAESEGRLAALAEQAGIASYAALAVMDPYVNALHVTLQQDLENQECHQAPEELEEWLTHATGAVEPARIQAILLDEQCCAQLHHRVWRQEEAGLGQPWQEFLFSYATPRRPQIFVRATARSAASADPSSSS
jgi:membrane glycosyltransferase